MIAVLGSAMDSGKTTSAAHLARGLSLHGLRVDVAAHRDQGARSDPVGAVEGRQVLELLRFFFHLFLCQAGVGLEVGEEFLDPSSTMRLSSSAFSS